MCHSLLTLSFSTLETRVRDLYKGFRKHPDRGPCHWKRSGSLRVETWLVCSVWFGHESLPTQIHSTEIYPQYILRFVENLLTLIGERSQEGEEMLYKFRLWVLTSFIHSPSKAARAVTLAALFQIPNCAVSNMPDTNDLKKNWDIEDFFSHRLDDDRAKGLFKALNLIIMSMFLYARMDNRLIKLSDGQLETLRLALRWHDLLRLHIYGNTHDLDKAEVKLIMRRIKDKAEAESSTYERWESLFRADTAVKSRYYSKKDRDAVMRRG